MIDAIHQSMVGMWLRCGEQFRRRYIENEILPPGIPARRGSAFHKSADTNHKQKISTGEDLPLGDLKDCASDEYKRLIRDEGVFIRPEKLPEKNALLNEGLNQSLVALEVYHDQVAPKIIPIGSEVKARADIGLDMPIAGTIDLVTVSQINDFKIHGRSSGQGWADSELQPDWYYELYRNIYGAYPKSFQYNEIVPLKKETKYNQYTTYRHGSDRLKAYTAIFLKSLNRGLFQPADISSWMCTPDWCGYYRTCAYRTNKSIHIGVENDNR